jgi:hypothetical protein
LNKNLQEQAKALKKWFKHKPKPCGSLSKPFPTNEPAKTQPELAP